MSPIRIAIIGAGKIACDQHLPAITASSDFVLAGTVGPVDPCLTDVPHFATLDALLEADPSVAAAAICTPPQLRHALASAAIARRLHVLLEKPPGATLGEVAALRQAASDANVTLFASWHSRFAAGVAPAREWLVGKRIGKASIIWREDVRVWHPGQAWIWQAGGLGVFDPGINALSIATEIFAEPLFLVSAALETPSNCAAPVAAQLDMRLGSGAAVNVDLDFLQVGPQSWDITVETDAGTLKLAMGGALLTLPEGHTASEDKEYPAVYAHFAELIRNGKSDVDVRPLALVADAFLIGHHEKTAPFIE
ncbi:MAG: Gfo/Idh/MocA family oxidoreductase [Sphingobium sp.]|nr:Gfo/Idh/MocA family oxidoreductase [Sphingobium sp.]